MSKNYGPNVTKLILQFVACEAIPTGEEVFGSVMTFFRDADKRKQILNKAETDALSAIKLIKSAPDNPFGDNDEAIAGILLQKIEERKIQQRGYP